MTSMFRILTALLMLAGFQAVAKKDADAPKEKVRPERGERFAKRDTNGDGKLTLEEFKVGLPEKATENAEAIFTKIDANGDGGIDKKEMKAAHDKRQEMKKDGKGPGKAGKGGKCKKGGDKAEKAEET